MMIARSFSVLALLSASFMALTQVQDELVDQLRQIASPLETVEDLDSLMERIGDARLALLGEASHGTSEYYTWRTEISKRLIEEKDFSFIAVEGDWAACERVNRYVRGESDAGDNAREVLMTFDRWGNWMWANEEIVELVEWLREHNADLPKAERVGFHGIDVYGFADSLAKAPRYASALDEAIGEVVASRFDCLVPFANDPQQYVRTVAMEQRTCEDDVAAAIAALRENAERLREIDADMYLAAKQNSMVVKYAERHFRAMLQQGPQSWNHRVDHFYQTVNRLLEHYGESSKGIVWAHNTHVGDARATQMGRQGMNNIGQHARETHGEENVVIVGFSTHRGTVIAGSAWEAPRRIMKVPEALSHSLDDLLNQLGKSQFLMVMRDAEDIDGFSRPRGHRAVGITYNPETEAQGNYVLTDPMRRYDVLIFIEQTTALKPLHK